MLALRLPLRLALLGFKRKVVGVELAQANEHGQHELPRRTRVVHLLAKRHEADPGVGESLKGLKSHPAVAGKSVELVHDHGVEPAGLGVDEHLLEGRPLGKIIAPGTAAIVAVNLGDVPSVGLTEKPTGAILRTEGIPFDLLLRRHALVERGTLLRYGRLSWSAGFGHSSSSYRVAPEWRLISATVRALTKVVRIRSSSTATSLLKAGLIPPGGSPQRNGNGRDQFLATSALCQARACVGIP